VVYRKNRLSLPDRQALSTVAAQNSGVVLYWPRRFRFKTKNSKIHFK
jgi:hypothetical protein